MSPQSRPFNQGLVVIEKVLQFANMDSNLTFLAEASVDLKRVNTTLYKIISQELNFLDQLTSFREMLFYQTKAQQLSAMHFLVSLLNDLT